LLLLLCPCRIFSIFSCCRLVVCFLRCLHHFDRLY
jgi:hypothetical protein